MSKAIVPVRPLELLIELPMGGSRLFAGQFELGLSLSQILARLSGLALPLSYFKHIANCCQGTSFDPQNWHRIKPKKAIKIVIKPQDDPQAAGLAAVTIAASLIAPGIGTAVAGALGLSALGATAVTTGVGLGLNYAGQVAVAALFPPPQAQLTPPRRTKAAMGASQPSVAMARNGLDLWGTIPRVYGKRRLWPSYAAAPFTETNEGEGVAYGLYCLGPGRYEVSELKIGDVDIAEFESLDYRVVAPDDDFDLWPGQVDQDSLGTRVSEGDPVTVLVDPCAKLVASFIFEEGLYEQTDQGVQAAAVELTARARPQGSTGAWAMLSGGDNYIVTDPVTAVSVPSAPYRVQVALNLVSRQSRFDGRIST